MCVYGRHTGASDQLLYSLIAHCFVQRNAIVVIWVGHIFFSSSFFEIDFFFVCYELTTDKSKQLICETKKKTVFIVVIIHYGLRSTEVVEYASRSASAANIANSRQMYAGRRHACALDYVRYGANVTHIGQCNENIRSRLRLECAFEWIMNKSKMKFNFRSTVDKMPLHAHFAFGIFTVKTMRCH